MGRQQRQSPQRFLRRCNHIQGRRSPAHRRKKSNRLVNQRIHFSHEHHSSNHGHWKPCFARQYYRSCNMAVLLTSFRCFRADYEHNPQHTHGKEVGLVGVDECDGPSSRKLHVGAGRHQHPTELHLEKRPPPLEERPMERLDFYRDTELVFLVPQWIR